MLLLLSSSGLGSDGSSAMEGGVEGLRADTGVRGPQGSRGRHLTLHEATGAFWLVHPSLYLAGLFICFSDDTGAGGYIS